MLNDIRFAKHASLGYFQSVPTGLAEAVRTSAFTYGFMLKVAESRAATKLLTQEELDVVKDIISSVKQAKAIVDDIGEETKVASLPDKDLIELIKQAANDGALPFSKVADPMAAMMGMGGMGGGGGMPEGLKAILEQLMGAQGGQAPLDAGGGGSPLEAALQASGGGEGAGAGMADPASGAMADPAGGAAGPGGGDAAGGGGILEMLKNMPQQAGDEIGKIPGHFDALQHMLSGVSPEVAGAGAGGAGLGALLGGGAMAHRKSRKKAASINGQVLSDVVRGADDLATNFSRSMDYLGVPAEVGRYIGGGPNGGLNVGVLSLLAA